jgi:hypothetical protein
MLCWLALFVCRSRLLSRVRHVVGHVDRSRELKFGKAARGCGDINPVIELYIRGRFVRTMVC